MAAMSDAPLRGSKGRHEWFWEPGDEESIYPLEELIDMYYRSVGHNSTLFLGLTPDPRGLLPEPDVQRLKELGDEIRRRFSNPLARISGSASKLFLNLDRKSEINTIVLREDISFGQRIRKYAVEAKIKGKWATIADGSSVGNKRIQEIETVKAREFRLVIHKSVAKPQIKDFSLFFIK